MREYVIEDAFRDEVARRGGLALKFTSQTMNGLPDRLALLPGGKAAFVELKAPGRTVGKSHDSASAENADTL